MVLTAEAVRRSMANYEANADVILYADPLQVMGSLAETSDLLGEFLGDQAGMNVTVMGITATCGQGFTNSPASNSSDSYQTASGPCVACPIGFYKEAMDNSPCAKKSALKNGRYSVEVMCH